MDGANFGMVNVGNELQNAGQTVSYNAAKVRKY